MKKYAEVQELLQVLVGCLFGLGFVLYMSVQPIDFMLKPLSFFHFSGLLIKGPLILSEQPLTNPSPTKHPTNNL